MTKDELYNELAADRNWAVQRCYGLQKKYNKQLRNSKVPHLAVLGRTWYETPNHNKVYTIAQKYYVDEKCKRAIVSITSLFEWTDNKGIKRYIYPLNSGSRMFTLCFTAHSISRMKERIGKDIFGVFEDICTKNDTNISVSPYTYNVDEGEYQTVIGDNIAFMIKGDWGYIVKTVISKESEYLNQTKDKASLMKRHNELSMENSKGIIDLFKDKALKHFAVKSA